MRGAERDSQWAGGVRDAFCARVPGGSSTGRRRADGRREAKMIDLCESLARALIAPHDKEAGRVCAILIANANKLLRGQIGRVLLETWRLVNSP